MITEECFLSTYLYKSVPKSLIKMYRIRLNRPRSFYSQNKFLGPDLNFQAAKTHTKLQAMHVNETSKVCFSCANASKNDIKI